MAKLRTLVAVKLYELGLLSSGRAAELAGMTRVEFLLDLRRYKVFPFEAELRDLEAARARAVRLSVSPEARG
jgi:predicted HTH domain antitoxin